MNEYAVTPLVMVVLCSCFHTFQGMPDGKVFEHPTGLRQLARHIMETWIAVVSVHVWVRG